MPEQPLEPTPSEGRSHGNHAAAVGPRRLVRALLARDCSRAVLSGPELVAAHAGTFGAAGAILAAADLVAGGLGRDLLTISLGSALGWVSGAMLGAAWAALALLARRRPRLTAAGLWVGVLAAAFALLADDLGAFEKLGTRHHWLAVSVLGACAAGALGIATCATLLQPSPDAEGPTSVSRQRTRWILVAVFASATASLAAVDRKLFVNGYPEAHEALRLTALLAAAWMLMHAAPVHRVWTGPGKGRIARRALAPATALLAAFPLAALADGDHPSNRSLLSRPFSALPLELLRQMADVDGDGYSGILGGGDCAPFDPAVSPGRADIPGNGVDENCYGGDARDLTAAAAEDVRIPSAPSPASVVLITIDTLRPDRMSAYGYERETSPHIEAWFTRGTRFDAAYAAGGWTSIAIPALLRGLYPRRLIWTELTEIDGHRVVRADARVKKGTKRLSLFLMPPEDPRKPLAWYLRRRGMFTAAVVDSGFTEVLSPNWGFGQGFDVYREVQKGPRKLRNDLGTAATAIRVLAERPRDRRFFLWVHFFGPHGPSTRHREVPNFGDTVEDKYDHEVAFADLGVGRLLRALESIPDLVVLLTSDHGERFAGTYRQHGRDVSEASIRVPLLVRGPGFPHRTVHGLASTIDLMPTILGVTGTYGPAYLDGIDLRDVARGSKAASNRVVFVDSFTLRWETKRFNRDLVAAINDRHKMVRNRISNSKSLHRRTDTGYPMKNLLPGTRDDGLENALETYLQQTGGTPTIKR